MQQCSNCGHQNRPGVVYCENCGASLLGKPPLSTKSIGSSTEEEKANLGVDSSVLTDVRVQGASAFSADDTLRLEIEGSPEPIIFTPKAETIFGRRDPATGAMPDIDLTPFAGYRMGVSRRHAAIRQGDESSLNLWDLGSSNGTYLNGQKLNAHRPYRLHDGDELRLGQMMIRCHFHSTSAEAQAKAEEAKPAEVAEAASPSSGPKTEEIKPTKEAASSEAEAEEAKPAQASPLMAQAGEEKPAQTVPPNAKPEKAKPSEAKAEEAKPAQATSSEAKPEKAPSTSPAPKVVAKPTQPNMAVPATASPASKKQDKTEQDQADSTSAKDEKQSESAPTVPLSPPQGEAKKPTSESDAGAVSATPASAPEEDQKPSEGDQPKDEKRD